MSKMKCALLFYGQPRFITNKITYESIKTYILNEFDVDIFCHFWFDSNKELYERSDFSLAPGGCPANYSPYIHPNTEQIIIDLYKPKAFVSEPSKNYDLPCEDDMPKCIKEYPSYRDKNLNNLKSQLHSWQKVLEIFSEYVDSHSNCEYSWIILTRYDLCFNGFINLNILGKESIVTSATCDVCIIPPKYCKYIKPYTSFNDFLKKVTQFDAAEWKRISFSTLPPSCWTEECIQFSLVREN